ncbi:DUF3606 domain-containing protein [Fluviicola sp.]|uniref:DUF3606 domain-containing protein n=1 Tax=Fluviicola sp. TaxID=1917219 RepID=UPI0031E2E8B4
MADNLNDRGNPDRNFINLNEEWEVAYWTKELGVSENDIAEAIQVVGNSAEKVRAHLNNPNAG